MNDCIFCKIIDGEIPSKREYEDDKLIVIHDVNPQAPIHLLAIPKAHIPSADGVNAENSAFVAHVFEVIPLVAAKLGITDNYQVINNCGEKAGQTIKHIHFHIISQGK